MPHDPHETFDKSVLDRIEQSPVGALPNTPAYQDALGRLYASHQVYASADHKDGHVTARSLVGAPLFVASNLRELVAGAIDPEALEPNSSIFSRYVGSLPADRRARAEAHRERVAGRPVLHRHKLAADVHDLVHTLFLVPGTGPHPGLPGNYLHGSVLQVSAEPGPGSWAVHIHDNDDGDALLRADSLQEALSHLQEVLDSAPFNMNELGALGFEPS